MSEPPFEFTIAPKKYLVFSPKICCTSHPVDYIGNNRELYKVATEQTVKSFLYNVIKTMYNIKLALQNIRKPLTNDKNLN